MSATAGGLRPAPYNPRNITPEQIGLLERAMYTFGDLGGIVFNVRTGHVVGGHQRLKVIPPDAEIERVRTVESQIGTVCVGWIRLDDGELWSYREVDWSEEVEALANIAANKHGGEFDFPAVADILGEVDTGEFDLQLSGFTDFELEALMAPVHQENDEPETPGGAGGVKCVTCPDCGREFEA